MFALNKGIVKLMGITFLLLVLGFTGIQTYSLLYTVSQSAITAAIGLILFEGGMIYWWQEFKSDAEGIGQMALSLILAVIGLLLVAGSTALHLGAIDKELIGTNTAARLITIAALVNLVGKFSFPLLSPDTFKEIWTRALEGMVIAKAYAKAQTMAEDMSAALAEEIGAEITRAARIRALTNFGLLHDGANDNIIEHEPIPNPAAHPRPSRQPQESEPEPTVNQEEELATANSPFRPQTNGTGNGFNGGEG
jgi:hypothetical protein